LIKAKTQISSVSLSLEHQNATASVSTILQESVGVIGQINKSVNGPQVAATCKALSTEMMKLSMIDDSIEDAFADMDGDELTDEADEEVDAIVSEITQGILCSVALPKRPFRQDLHDESAKESANEYKIDH
jgi:charged multivesicular body protein 3